MRRYWKRSLQQRRKLAAAEMVGQANRVRRVFRRLAGCAVVLFLICAVALAVGYKAMIFPMVGAAIVAVRAMHFSDTIWLRYMTYRQELLDKANKAGDEADEQ